MFPKHYGLISIILSIFWVNTYLSEAQTYNGSLTLVWDANTEQDLAGYRIYYGFSSRQYLNFLEVGKITEYTIKHLQPEREYFIALTAFDYSGNESGFSSEVSAYPDTALSEETAIPVLLLYQNYPNPFSKTNLMNHGITTIPYSLTKDTKISLRILNIKGQIVKTVFAGDQTSGIHEAFWDGTEANGHPVAAGIYFIRLKSPHFHLTKSIIVLP